MTSYSFRVPGKPAVKSRPRFNRGHAHSTEKTQIFEAKVSMAAEAAGVRPLVGPVELYVDFHMPRPQNRCRKKDPNGPIPSDKRPDLDNLVKAIKDGLNGVGYADDSQVAYLQVTKFYHPKDEFPQTKIVLREWAIELEDEDDDDGDG